MSEIFLFAIAVVSDGREKFKRRQTSRLRRVIQKKFRVTSGFLPTRSTFFHRRPALKTAEQRLRALPRLRHVVIAESRAVSKNECRANKIGALNGKDGTCFELKSDRAPAV